MADVTDDSQSEASGFHPASAENPDRDIVTIFIKALRALGRAGNAEEAMKLGGQAWWALNPTDPRGAERVNGSMHYLARLQAKQEAERA